MKKWFLLALIVGMGGFLYSQLPAHGRYRGPHKLIILGIDGMDPQLLHRFMQSGKMPNFSRLAREGSFHTLTTSIPPQSPVAWSTVITGLDSGGHGIFDFVHRDPQTITPYSSMAEVREARKSLTLGPWVLPLESGAVKSLRRGISFWELLSQGGVPATVTRMPTNFPPVEFSGQSLAGMGTPDMQGGFGKFTYFTSDPDTKDSQVSVAAKDGKVTLSGSVKSPAAQQKIDQIAHEETGAPDQAARVHRTGAGRAQSLEHEALDRVAATRAQARSTAVSG